VKVIVSTTVLLIGSNIFMTLAWYGHLRYLDDKPWFVAVVAAWGVAFFEYCLQVPANRIGFTKLSVPQLKLLQEAISLTVFVPIAFRLFNVKLRLDFLWAALCILGAVFFAFRGGLDTTGSHGGGHAVTRPAAAPAAPGSPADPEPTANR
jgi:uncharacterized protein (DUF486 family)